jgi:redox-sensitive bicupin YhaK (pirin superfamily)
MTSSIINVKEAKTVSEGRGVTVHRLFPTNDFMKFDPFALFDEFIVEKPAGFPLHRHSGFEFITYMIEGSLKHRDSIGNEMTVNEGGAQRAITGTGIEHSEMPVSEGVNRGIQLWISLPRRFRERNPEYQIFEPDDLPIRTSQGLKAKIIAGEDSPLQTSIQIDFLDITLNEGKIYKGKIPDNYNTLLYILYGEIEIEGNAFTSNKAALLRAGSNLKAKMKTKSRFLYLSGKPLNEEYRVSGSSVIYIK